MNKVKSKTKTKLKKGDKVLVIAGADKGKQGKILAINQVANRVIVEGVNMLTKHVKPGRKKDQQQGGMIHQEGYIHASNVMCVHNGSPTRIGIKRVDDGVKKTKIRFARSTGDEIRD